VAKLNLPDGPSVAVWRVIKAKLDADTTLPGAGIGLSYFDGNPQSLADLDQEAPVLQFYPQFGPQSWFDEGSVAKPLAVNVRAVLEGYDVEDALNLQDALEGVLNTIGDMAFQQSLVDAGAVTGLILFSRPLNQSPAAAANDGLFRLNGSFTIDVRHGLNL
jgi:hypothetical protein